MKTFGQLLRQHRKAKGYTATYVADQMNLSLSSIVSIEKGRYKATWDYLEKLKPLLGITGEEAERLDDMLSKIRGGDEGRRTEERLLKRGVLPGEGRRVAVAPRLYGGDLRQLPMGRDTVAVPEDIIMTKDKVIAFRVVGDDLWPRLAEGDTVIASLDARPKKGDLCIYQVNGKLGCRF